MKNQELVQRGLQARGAADVRSSLALLLCAVPCCESLSLSLRLVSFVADRGCCGFDISGADRESTAGVELEHGHGAQGDER